MRRLVGALARRDLSLHRWGLAARGCLKNPFWQRRGAKPPRAKAPTRRRTPGSRPTHFAKANPLRLISRTQLVSNPFTVPRSTNSAFKR